MQTGPTLRLARVSRVLVRCHFCEFLAYCEPELFSPANPFLPPCPERAARCSARACPPPALDRGTAAVPFSPGGGGGRAPPRRRRAALGPMPYGNALRQKKGEPPAEYVYHV